MWNQHVSNPKRLSDVSMRSIILNSTFWLPLLTIDVAVMRVSVEGHPPLSACLLKAASGFHSTSVIFHRSSWHRSSLLNHCKRQLWPAQPPSPMSILDCFKIDSDCVILKYTSPLIQAQAVSFTTMNDALCDDELEQAAWELQRCPMV